MGLGVIKCKIVHAGMWAVGYTDWSMLADLCCLAKKNSSTFSYEGMCEQVTTPSLLGAVDLSTSSFPDLHTRYLPEYGWLN